jgi:putative DNA primase/helicase
MESNASISLIEDLKNGKNVIPLYSEIFNELLNKVKPIDLENTAKQLGKVKLKDEHYLVLVVEHILELIKKNKWGLYKKYGFIYLHNGNQWVEITWNEFRNFLSRAAEKMGIDKVTAGCYQFGNKLFKQFLFAANLPSLETSKKKER